MRDCDGIGAGMEAVMDHGGGFLVIVGVGVVVHSSSARMTPESPRRVIPLMAMEKVVLD